MNKRQYMKYNIIDLLIVKKIESLTGAKFKWWQRIYITIDWNLKHIKRRLDPNSSYNKFRRFIKKSTNKNIKL